MSDTGIVLHVAGSPVIVPGKDGGPRFIQRCLICGEKLLDNEDDIGLDPEDYLGRPANKRYSVIMMSEGMIVKIVGGKSEPGGPLLSFMDVPHGGMWVVPRDYPSELCVDLVEKSAECSTR